MKYLIMLFALLLLPSCIYTESALEYAREGTTRVHDGYEAKAKMTAVIVKHLERMNKDCGVRITMVNGSPVTTVRDCVRFSDAMVAVNKMPIIVPQQIDDIADGIGDMLIKATNIVVPVASLYYGYRTHEESMETTRATTASNNEMISGMISDYTGNFQDTTTLTTTTSTDVSSSDVSDTSTSSTDVSTTSSDNIDSSNNTETAVVVP